MNDSSKTPFEKHGNFQESSTQLRRQFLFVNDDFDCAESDLTTETFSDQFQEIYRSFNPNDETAYKLPPFECTFIKKIPLNVIPSASSNEIQSQKPDLNEDLQFVNHAVGIDNKAQHSIGSRHNYSELIDAYNNIEPANLLEISEVSQQRGSPVNVSSTLQLEEEVKTRKKFFTKSRITIENPSNDVLGFKVQSILRTSKNVCSDCGNAFTPKTKMDQHNVVRDDCICRRKVFPQSSSNLSMLTHTEDISSVASSSDSQLFIYSDKQKHLIKNCNLQRNKLFHERNICHDNAPEVAIYAGTQYHKHADVPHKPYVKRHLKENASFRTSRDMTGNSSSEYLGFEVASSSELKGHICQDSGKDYISNSELKRFSVVQTGAKPFGGDIWQKAFNQKGNLNRHKLIDHPETFQTPRANTSVRTSGHMPGNSSCEILEKKVSSRSVLERHICHDCLKGFPDKSKLDRHSVIHTGEKPFVCDICQKSYTRKDHLNRHKKTHQPEIFQMPRVNSSFKTSIVMPGNSSRENLEYEIASSSELKRHIFQHCGKGLSLNSKLKRHSVVHTGEKPFVCDICQKAYSKKGHLNDHKKVKHPETFQK